MKKFSTVGLVLAAAVSFALVGSGCKHDEEHDHKSTMTHQSMPTKSLYERLGGEPALTLVVDDFVNRAAGDPAVNFTRKGTGMEWNATPDNVMKLKKHLVQFIAQATGGPQKYEGKAMKPLHAGMKITSAEFDALAKDLIASLDKFKVPQREKDELIAVVASTKGDIVEMK